MFGQSSAFTPDRFVATQWETAERKAQFAHEFIRFVESDFEKSLFTKEFYRRLSNTFGHIGHYNQGGFYEEFFTTAEDKVRFLQQSLDYPCYGDPAFTYSDVERALQVWVRENEILGKYQEQVFFPSNEVRAERFAAVLPNYPDDDHTNSIDVLTDCLHWCEREGIDFERLLRVARDHYEVERNEEHGHERLTEDKDQAPSAPEAQEAATKRKDEVSETRKEAAINKAGSNEATVLGDMAVAPARRTVAPDDHHNEEIIMADTSEFKELCSFDSGRFKATVTGRLNPASQTYTYTANVLCDDKSLFNTQLKHELAGLRSVATEGGQEWLTRQLSARGVPDGLATTQDFQDFQIAVRTSEKLIGRFAEHGHEAALKDRTVLQDIGLEARQEAAQEVRTITRER